MGKIESFNLDRFHKAQSAERGGYETALTEIKSGCKRGHWIWYIFPQLKNLGKSRNAKYYGINGVAEARAYLDDATLRARLTQISQALAALDETDSVKILGHTDALKVKSCMMLFLSVDPNNSIFQAVMNKYFNHHG